MPVQRDAPSRCHGVRHRTGSAGESGKSVPYRRGCTCGCRRSERSRPVHVHARVSAPEALPILAVDLRVGVEVRHALWPQQTRASQNTRRRRRDGESVRFRCARRSACPCHAVS
eukprot:3315438-Rhodomonas_salina.1